MKYLLGVFSALLIIACGWLYYALGDYSHGYRMGTLSSFERRGYVPFLKSGEGQLLLGRESSPLAADYTTSDGFRVLKDFNPWRFSVNQGESPEYEKLIGRQSWLEYREHRYNLSLLRETPYEAQNAGEITRAAPAPPVYEVKKPMTLGRSEGVRAGRLVKVSTKGKVLNTWEIVLQVGDAGNQFKPMSIDDEGMYAYAIKWLKTGNAVNVHYVDKGVMKFDFNDTPYEVWKIEASSAAGPLNPGK